MVVMSRTPQNVLHLLPELATQVDVQIAERFIEQQELRTRSQSASQSDALLLAAGDLVRITFGHVLQTHQLQQVGKAAVAVGSRAAKQAKHNVLGHRHMWEEGVLLKHHANVAFFPAPPRGRGD